MFEKFEKKLRGNVPLLVGTFFVGILIIFGLVGIVDQILRYFGL